MGWKNIKEHYRIDHQVQVTDDGVCIGSPYIHNIIVISLEGKIVKEDDRTLNDKLSRYQAEMHADPAKLKDLVVTPDTFTTSIPVFTYEGAEIIEERCEELGWPNVTHNGRMMYANTYFANREDALEAAKRNCVAAIMLRHMEASDKQKRLDEVRARLEELKSDARKLGVPDANDKAGAQSNLAAITPQMVRDTAAWCQSEDELRETLLLAAIALEAAPAPRDHAVQEEAARIDRRVADVEALISKGVRPDGKRFTLQPVEAAPSRNAWHTACANILWPNSRTYKLYDQIKNLAEAIERDHSDIDQLPKTSTEQRDA